VKHHITNNNHTTDHVAKHPSPVYSNIGVNNVNNVYTDINTNATVVTTINSTNINTPRTVHPRPALMFSAPQESDFHSPHLSCHHPGSHFSSFDVCSSLPISFNR
jgi:hypothetical protein